MTVYGYCAITADFFHIGHYEFLSACKNKCEKLIVGIMTDDCVEKYKGKRPIMDYLSRKKIVESIKFVYKTLPQDTFEFPHHLITLKNFYGKNYIIFDSEEHKRKGADIIIPRTELISSSLFKKEYML